MPDTEYFKSRLLELKQEHMLRITMIDHDIRHEDLPADWTEQATERENDEVLESLGNASEDELGQIEHALARIDSGTYFFCSECGAPIPTARLKLLPFATHCVECAEMLEARH
jgi:RNA polymerase-binding protein DksA